MTWWAAPRGWRLDVRAELEERGVRFQAVIHSITADQWRRATDRRACPCAA